jgi:aspartate 1-decarboxylase
MNTLKVKATIHCNTCGCEMKRVKSITVSATNKDDAKIEANEKVQVWRKSLTGQNCKVCQSIINS